MRRLWWLPALALVACDATEVPGNSVVDEGTRIDGAVDMFVPPPEPDMGPLGLLGDPCNRASECESAYCVASGDDTGVCSIGCVEGEANACPEGWYCEQSFEYGRAICRPAARLPICSPCTDDRQCGGPRDLCLPLLGQPGNMACARDCTARECPAGFTCQQFGDGRQCVPDEGLCPDEIPDDDRDGDGVPDDEDRCPDEYGEAMDGCPMMPPDDDLDRDGIPDDEDACPQQAGALPNGCPVGALNGQIISGGGLFELFGRGLEGMLGADVNTAPMSSPSYRIQPISIGVKP